MATHSIHEYDQLLKEQKLARFERASRLAGAAAEQMGPTERQLEQEMEAIKEQAYHQKYGR